MKPNSTVLLVVCLAVLLVVGIPFAAKAQSTSANPEFYQSERIYPGLRGFAKICFNGSEIHEVPVEVISLLGQRTPEKPSNYYGFIARISGPIIDITHGIGEGSSGAPVYFNNKLAGSIIGLVDYDYGSHDLISCRTIAESLKLFDYPSFKPQANPTEQVQPVSKPLALMPALKLAGHTYTEIDITGNSSKAVLSIRPCTKIIRTSKTDETYDPFIPWWKRHKNLALAPVYSTLHTPLEKQRDSLPLQPGAPVAIVMVRGDVNWVIIGAMTYIAPDGRFIAFGHDNFDRAGSINLPCASANYLTTITNMNRFITMAQSKDIFGAVLEDRREGMAGKLGEWKGSWIPVSVSTKQTTEKRNLALNFEVANTPELAWDSLRSVVSYSTVRSLDSYGDINLEAAVNLSINTNPAKEISYRNCYSTDAINRMLNDLNLLSLKLELNDRQVVFPTKLSVDLVSVQGRERARIFNVELLDKSNQPLKPKDTGQFTVTKGEELRVKVYLQYYNGKVSEAVHNVKWPTDDKHFGNGTLVLQVFGGAGLSPVWLDNAPQIIQEADSYRNRFVEVKDLPAPNDFDEVYANLLPTYQNDNLVIQIVNTNSELREPNGNLPNNATVIVPKPRNTISGFKRFDLEVVAAPTEKK